ncbi:hypothetical protein K2173_025502 [Erythroxylum novogranatense]|uniref:Sodium/calcium exchanger membrane region domain-containing protein n=1 Tax=Erythroxylum novogranatense TaxID=1862640 RepID=A0AAV8T8J5_9ROSI|nr:hypothetical protein K2173_025502 [Erythroxylum novogranatense]
MARFNSISQPKKFTLFLNTSFLFLCIFYILTLHLSDQANEPKTSTSSSSLLEESIKSSRCAELDKHPDYKSKCMYVKSDVSCKPKGYINYLQIYYCTCGQFPVLGQVVLSIWLLVMFYLLGDTAANFFCFSLESLSKILKLSPTVAGVTLLSLGNGAPDVFASIVAFTRSNSDVGLNSILGGAFFVSSFVVGVISIVISSQEISVDKFSFIRDVCFFLFTLCSLLLIILRGQINLWGSISFLSIYFFYVSVVCIMHLHYRNQKKVDVQDTFVNMGIPLLGYADEEKQISADKNRSSEHQQQTLFNVDPSSCCSLDMILYVLELPLSLPRKLTIPVVSEERWSKPLAVSSVTMAPLLVAALINTQSQKTFLSRSSIVTYMTGVLIGVVLGNLAYMTTDKSSPPKKCLLPWLAGSFSMSVIWTYIIAEDLVSLLVSIGYILGINPSVLGLTVLAWGNSLGDLIANGAMAMHGGSDGTQVAISGCYAGPLFNTLMGLGTPLVIKSWSKYPGSYVIPKDPSLVQTLGFSIGGLLWVLVILPRKNMKLDRFLGVGLLAIYLCFLSLRLLGAFGLLKVQGV